MSEERTFKIQKNYYCTGTLIFKRASVTIKSGLTILVGCNGSGKTTLLNHLKNELKKTGTPVITFDNPHNAAA